MSDKSAFVNFFSASFNESWYSFAAFDTLLFSLSVSVIFFCFAIETMQYMRVSSSTVTSLIYFSTFDASSVSSRFTSYIVPYRFL